MMHDSLIFCIPRCSGGNMIQLSLLLIYLCNIIACAAIAIAITVHQTVGPNLKRNSDTHFHCAISYVYTTVATWPVLQCFSCIVIVIATKLVLSALGE